MFKVPISSRQHSALYYIAGILTGGIYTVMARQTSVAYALTFYAVVITVSAAIIFLVASFFTKRTAKRQAA